MVVPTISALGPVCTAVMTLMRALVLTPPVTFTATGCPLLENLLPSGLRGERVGACSACEQRAKTCLAMAIPLGWNTALPCAPPPCQALMQPRGTQGRWHDSPGGL